MHRYLSFRRLTDATLSSLQSCSTDEVRRVVIESPTQSCALDPIPTFLLKECIDILLPFLSAMVNASLRYVSLPASQKRAIVSPLLKKPSLDPSEMCNYRPVSNLTFVSKVVERVVVSQLTRYLQSHDLMPRMQSACRKYHSTALLRVLSDIYAAVDERRVTLLALLDLSAAFDCVDHDILVPCAVFNWRTGSKVRRQRGSHLPQRPDPPNILPRTAIRSQQPSVRCPTRLCTGPAAFPVVRRRAGRGHCCARLHWLLLR